SRRPRTRRNVRRDVLLVFRGDRPLLAGPPSGVAHVLRRRVRSRAHRPGRDPVQRQLAAAPALLVRLAKSLPTQESRSGDAARGQRRVHVGVFALSSAAPVAEQARPRSAASVAGLRAAQLPRGALNVRLRRELSEPRSETLFPGKKAGRRIWVLPRWGVGVI